MKKMILSLIAVTFLLSGDLSGANPEKQAPLRQIMFKVQVLEGDPLGSRKAGTIKVLAEPTFVTTEKRPFSMKFGKLGFIHGKPCTAKDGKVRLDLTLSHTVAENQSDDRLRLSTTETRFISTVKLGEVTRLRVGKTDSKPDQQRWVEITPELISPLEGE